MAVNTPSSCLLVTTLLLCGCLGPCVGPGTPSPSPPAGKASSSSTADGRGLVGRVTWSGSPQPVAVSTPADPCSGTGLPVGKDIGAQGGVADVVVRVAEAPASATESRSLELSAHNCRFEPVVAAVPAGVRLVADNRDGRLHTFHLRRLHPQGGWSNLQNLAVPPGGLPASWVLEEPGTLHVTSDQIPGMESWIVVYEPGQATVTDAQGRFELPQLPAGQWDVQFWHPRFGTTVMPVLIPKDGPASLYASLPPSL